MKQITNNNVAPNLPSPAERGRGRGNNNLIISKMKLKRFLFTTICMIIALGNLTAQIDFGDPDNIKYDDENNRGENFIFPVPIPKNGSTKDIIAPSSKVASLGTFGQIPVGHYTGTATIEIPLYTISYKDLELPINIVYNTLGNKPDMFPGPVGLGWALQAGGMITRIINGNPPARGDLGMAGWDIRGYSDWYDVYKHFGIYIQAGILSFDENTNPDEFVYNINGQTGSFYENHEEVFQVRSDQGEFFHVILHKRGSIRYGFPKPPQMTGLSINQQDYLFGNTWAFSSPDYAWKDTITVRNIINGFTMIDSNGIKYTFGNTAYVKNNDNAIEFSRLGHSVYVTDYIPFVQATAWHLTSIESPNGYKITLKYERESYVTKFHLTDMALYKVLGAQNVIRSNDARWQNAYRSVFINGSVLSEIEFPGGKAVFNSSIATEQLVFDENPSGSTPESKIDNYDDINYMNCFYYYPDISFANTEKIVIQGTSENNSETVRNRFLPKKFDKITILETAGNSTIRMIDFNYTNSRSTRLKLLSVNISGSVTNSASDMKYQFQYNTTSLPHYLSKRTDHYGFYNNKLLYDGISYSSLNSHILNNLNYFNNVKMPDFNYAKAEILTKIIYPTGGYSEITYEKHDFGKVYVTWNPFGTRDANSSDLTRLDAGGLRVQSIKNYDFNGSLLNSTNYKYVTQSGGSSGVLAYIPEYVSYYQSVENTRSTGQSTGQGQQNGFYNGTGTQIVNKYDYFLRYSSNPIHPMGNTRGNHITYTEVKVFEGDNQGVNGFTIYKFKNYDNGYADKPLRGYVCCKLRYINNISNGIEYWKNEEGISMKQERGLPVSVEVFDNSATPKKVKKTEFIYNDNENRFNESVRFLKNIFNDITLTGTTNMMVTTGEHYTYDPWLKRQREVHYFGTDSIVKTKEYSYNEQYRLLKTIEMTDSNGDLLKNETFYPFEQPAGVNATMLDRFMLAYPTGVISKRNDVKIAEAKTEYATGLANNNSNLILPYKEYFSYGNETPEQVVTFNIYDKTGNPLSLTDFKSGDKVCYLWSYNGSYPVLKIVGMDYEDVKSALGGENTINTLWLNMNPQQSQIETIRTTLTNAGALVTSYTYKPLVGTLTETDFRGVTTYYEYDSLGRLKEIKVGEKSSPASNETQRKVGNYEYKYKPSEQ